jgi:hypothetical protein
LEKYISKLKTAAFRRLGFAAGGFELLCRKDETGRVNCCA